MALEAPTKSQPPGAETNSPPDPLPIVFGPPTFALFGLYHAPPGSWRRDVGVVLCNPLGFESMCSHRTYRHLAERLAAKGIAALRFDYHGTGDSSGGPDQPRRGGAWLESIHAAIAEVRLRSGVRAVALFGVRFGATLACCAAADQGGVDDLMLWAPFPSGREFLRELRAFRMIKQHGLEDNSARSDDGGEEAAGYAFDKQTVLAVSSLDVATRQGPLAKRVLVVPRDDMPGGEARLTRHLRASGAAVEVAREPGYAGMMRDPQDVVVPGETLDKIVAWIARSHEPVAGGPASSVREPRAFLTTLGTSRNHPVRERAVRFGASGRLVGIATEPVSQGLPPGRPAFLFLNTGANHHVGPNRMYVSLSRTLAPLGHLCFRFDVAGLGDSKTAPGAQENKLFSMDSVADIKAAMNLLHEQYGADSFVLAGLCSGAYLAFHTCLGDPRVVGQILINPPTFEWKEGDSTAPSTRRSLLATRYYVHTVFKASTWLRLFRGKIDVPVIATVMRERALTRAKNALQGLSNMVRLQAEPLTDVARSFRSMSDRGVESLVLFSFNDGGLDMIAAHLGTDARKMRRRKNFHFEIVEDADHTFTPVKSQVRVRDIIVRYATTYSSRGKRGS